MDITKEIEVLVRKAEQAAKSEDALRFSQAACNAANAMACVNSMPISNHTANKNA